MIYHFIAIVLAVCIDMLIGDPPNWPHPVKGFGKLISFFDKMWNYGSNRKLKGVLMLIILIAIVFSLSVGDRKSTRLNSSHVSISYAVFCLKKKKKNHLLF